MNNLFLLTLNQMPLMFTSNEFAKKARINGVPDRLLKTGMGGNFLHKHCDQYETTKTWQKRVLNNKIILTEKPVFKQKTEVSFNTLTEDNCIKFLKERGYKIMKYTEI